MPRGAKPGRPKQVKLSKNGKRLGRPPGSKTKLKIEQLRVEPEKKPVTKLRAPVTTTTRAASQVTATTTAGNVGMNVGVLKFVPSPESVLQLLAMELRLMADRLLKVNGVAVTVTESTTLGAVQTAVETVKRVKKAIEYKPEEDVEDEAGDTWDEDDAEMVAKDADAKETADPDDDDDDIPDAAAKAALQEDDDDDDSDESDDDDDDEDDTVVAEDDDDPDDDDDDEEIDDDGKEAGAAEEDDEDDDEGEEGEDDDEDDEVEEKVPAKGKGAKDRNAKLKGKK